MEGHEIIEINLAVINLERPVNWSAIDDVLPGFQEENPIFGANDIAYANDKIHVVFDGPIRKDDKILIAISKI